MDLSFDKPFVIKSKTIKSLVSLLNSEIENKLKKSIFYEEDKEYFYFPNINLKIESIIKTKNLIFKNLIFHTPKLIILKGKRINNYFLKHDEWLIIPHDIRDNYVSENKIYVFTLS